MSENFLDFELQITVTCFYIKGADSTEVTYWLLIFITY